MLRFRILLVPALAMLLAGCEKAKPEYQFVDLGLSVKWAKVNVGALTTKDYGNRYAWGEVQTKSSYSAENYRWFDEDGMITKYCSNESYEKKDNLTELEKIDDVAAREWGNGWRMPTYKELMELVNNCTWTWSFIDGVRGYKVCSKIKGYEDRYIFLPAAGCHVGDTVPETDYEGKYWTSTNCGGNNSRLSQCLNFTFSGVTNDGYADGVVRTVGASIRPVHD